MQTRNDLKLLVDFHSKRLHLDTEESFRHLMVFSRIVGLIENSGKLVGKNPLSSAKGLYQFINGSVGPAINRTKRYIGTRPWMHLPLDPNTLGWEEQTLMFLGDMLGKRGSDSLMRLVMTGDRKAMLKAYLKFHHTDPDRVTIDRAETLFSGTLYDDG